MGEFVHLNVHTNYSLLDGACGVDLLIKRAKEIGQKAIAITDKGNMYGVVEFYNKCLESQIKPIIGCKIYVESIDSQKKKFLIQVTLICKNDIGYRNLLKLASFSHLNYYSKNSIVNISTLRENSNGLICIYNFFEEDFRNFSEDKFESNNYNNKIQNLIAMSKFFEKDNFYLEIFYDKLNVNMKNIDNLIMNPMVKNIPLVCTNNVHYVERSDSILQKILYSIKNNKILNDQFVQSNFSDELYLKSYEEMIDIFENFPEAIANTVKIASMCNFKFDFKTKKFPKYTLKKNIANNSYLKKLSELGLKKRYNNISSNVLQRLLYELKIIEDMGYVDYYLIVYDFIKYAKDNKIPVGPGRGSGAGSLVAYCIGITDVDPIQYNLIFERFLNPDRISMPDFDVDFCYERRQEVINYIIGKYGSSKVAHIVTFGTMGARAAIRDVGKVLGIKSEKIDRIAKLIPTTLNISLSKSLEISNDLQLLYVQDFEVKELLDNAKKIEGFPRHKSTHAAGIIITDDDILQSIPLSKNEDVVVTQYSMHHLEKLGFLKIDLLGLRNLSIIKNCNNHIKRFEEFEIDNIDFEDNITFEMLSKGDSFGVFQLESKGVKELLKLLKPKNIEDLTAIISLHRPGPIESGTISNYIENKNNNVKLKYNHNLLKPILGVTYGCIIYQEQVMRIFRDLAGYSYQQADLVRRAMSKKQSEIMSKEREHFLAGCEKRGIGKNVSIQLFEDMLHFSSYAFNKSHAVCYAIVAYKTAYLKRHYPKEYMSALLTSVIDNTPKLIEYINQLGKMRIKMLSPDINFSKKEFIPNKNGILFSLLVVKNVGHNFLEKLIEERLKGHFTDFKDFCCRMHKRDLNKKMLENLIKAGAFDELESNRKFLIKNYERIFEDLNKNAKENIDGQINLFASNENNNENYFDFSGQNNFYTFKEKLDFEKEVTNIYISGHPTDGFEVEKYECIDISEIKRNFENISPKKDVKNIKVLGIILSKKAIYTKQGSKMAFIKIEDKTGVIEVILFAKIYSLFFDKIVVGNVIIFDCVLSPNQNIRDINLICNNVYTPKENNLNNKILYLKLDKSQLPNILNLVLKFPGDSKVHIVEKNNLEMRILPDKYNVTICNDLKKELSDLIGENNIIFRG